MHSVRFDIPPCPSGQLAALRVALGVSDPLAQVLVRRGLGDPAAARAFLQAGEGARARDDGSAFQGIDPAIETILSHVRAGERITIHGDYDVDGVCSTAVLVRGLRALRAEVDWHLPDRSADGYGLRESTVERLAARGTRLLITADCGITAVEEVARARALGMQVVVSDHHALRADGLLPDAPIVHPGLGDYPHPDICATAVAHRLVQALWAAGGGDSDAPEDDLDLVALATIADVVPLVGENRALVRRGLRSLANTSKLGLRALMSIARVDSSRLDERAVGFALAPRINAAGRLYRADAALELVLTEDPRRAATLATELDRANHERRETERHILYEAEAQVAELGPRAAYVLAGEGWHPGVIGIVASRLVERHHRPVLVISLDGECGRGSGRSIEGFDLLAGLAASGELLLRYGGHRAAAGVELRRTDVPQLAAVLCAHAERVLTPEDLVSVERVDAIVDGGQLDMGLAEELGRLAPFGRGNRSVSLLVRGATFRDVRPMGEGKHVRFTVMEGETHANAVAFGTGGRLPVKDGDAVDATFKLEVNEWNGMSEPRLVLRNVMPAAPEVAARRAVHASEPEIAENPRAGEPELVLF